MAARKKLKYPRVGLAGIGELGYALLPQLSRLEGIEQVVLATRSTDKFDASASLGRRRSFQLEQVDTESPKSLDYLKNNTDVLVVTLDNNEFHRLIEQGQPIDRTKLLANNLELIKRFGVSMRGYDGHVVMVSNPTDALARVFATYMKAETGQVTGFNDLDRVRAEFALNDFLQERKQYQGTYDPRDLKLYVGGLHEVGGVIPFHVDVGGAVPITKEVLERRLAQFITEAESTAYNQLMSMKTTTPQTVDALIDQLSAMLSGDEKSVFTASNYMQLHKQPGVYIGWPVRFKELRAKPALEFGPIEGMWTNRFAEVYARAVETQGALRANPTDGPVKIEYHERESEPIRASSPLQLEPPTLSRRERLHDTFSALKNRVLLRRKHEKTAQYDGPFGDIKLTDPNVRTQWTNFEYAARLIDYRAARLKLDAHLKKVDEANLDASFGSLWHFVMNLNTRFESESPDYHQARLLGAGVAALDEVVGSINGNYSAPFKKKMEGYMSQLKSQTEAVRSLVPQATLDEVIADLKPLKKDEYHFPAMLKGAAAIAVIAGIVYGIYSLRSPLNDAAGASIDAGANLPYTLGIKDHADPAFIVTPEEFRRAMACDADRVNEYVRNLLEPGLIDYGEDFVHHNEVATFNQRLADGEKTIEFDSGAFFRSKSNPELKSISFSKDGKEIEYKWNFQAGDNIFYTIAHTSPANADAFRRFLDEPDCAKALTIGVPEQFTHFLRDQVAAWYLQDETAAISLLTNLYKGDFSGANGTYVWKNESSLPIKAASIGPIFYDLLQPGGLTLTALTLEYNRPGRETVGLHYVDTEGKPGTYTLQDVDSEVFGQLKDELRGVKSQFTFDFTITGAQFRQAMLCVPNELKTAMGNFYTTNSDGTWAATGPVQKAHVAMLLDELVDHVMTIDSASYDYWSSSLNAEIKGVDFQSSNPMVSIFYDFTENSLDAQKFNDVNQAAAEQFKALLSNPGCLLNFAPPETAAVGTNPLGNFRTFNYSRADIDKDLALHPDAKAYLADRLQNILRGSFFMQGHGFLKFDNWIVTDVPGTLDMLLDGKAALGNNELIGLASHKNEKGDYVLEIHHTVGGSEVLSYFSMRTPDLLIDLDTYLQNLPNKDYKPTAAMPMTFTALDANEAAIKEAWACFPSEISYNLYVLLANSTGGNNLNFASATQSDAEAMMRGLTNGTVANFSPGAYNPRDASQDPELTRIYTVDWKNGTYNWEFQLRHADTTTSFSIETENLYVTRWLTETFMYPNCNN